MTTALEHVRHGCGMAGEEVADMVDALQAEIAALKKRKLVLSQEQKERFNLRTNDLVRWLFENCNPHTKIVITSEGAELVEVVLGTGVVGCQVDTPGLDDA